MYAYKMLGENAQGNFVAHAGAEVLMQTVYIEGGFVRKLWDVETDAYRDHLLRLDAESRRNRFSATIADEAIRSFASAVPGPDVIVHGFFVDGVLRGAADLHIVRPLDLREAEAAFSIEKPWQSRGVGSALLERTLLCARNRGVKHLQVTCLPQNKPMQQLARKFEARFAFDYDTVIGTIDNPDATPLSVAQEGLADGFSGAAAYADFQSRVLRPATAFFRQVSYRRALGVS
jgi:GNAT superfamily N-acetyltransferase